MSTSALKSFAPVPMLVKHRDADALFLKLGIQRGLIEKAERWRAIAGLVVQRAHADQSVGILEWAAPVTGKDAEGNVVIRRGSSVGTELALRRAKGRDDLMRGLSHAAGLISGNEDLRQRPYVYGVTYREVADAAIRTAGFYPLEISKEDGMDPSTWSRLVLAHSVFCALNHRPQPVNENPYSLDTQAAMVYMPTDEFVARFGNAPQTSR